MYQTLFLRAPSDLSARYCFQILTDDEFCEKLSHAWEIVGLTQTTVSYDASLMAVGVLTDSGRIAPTGGRGWVHVSPTGFMFFTYRRTNIMGGGVRVSCVFPISGYLRRTL